MATGEEVKVSCDVIADPNSKVKFEWVFNTSSEWYNKQPEVTGMTARGRDTSRSIVKHLPKVSLIDGWPKKTAAPVAISRYNKNVFFSSSSRRWTLDRCCAGPRMRLVGKTSRASFI